MHQYASLIEFSLLKHYTDAPIRVSAGEAKNLEPFARALQALFAPMQACCESAMKQQKENEKEHRRQGRVVW
jgi:hypothetical protein